MGPTVGWNSLLIELFWPKLCSNGSKKGWIRLWSAGLNWHFGAETDLFIYSVANPAMIFKSFTIAIFIASLENKRISSLVGNHENTVNSAGSRSYDKGGVGGGGSSRPWNNGGPISQKYFGLKIRWGRTPRVPALDSPLVKPLLRDTCHNGHSFWRTVHILTLV